MSKLKPPKNIRNTTPKCCATCRHSIVSGLEFSESQLDCEREPDTLSPDETIYTTICDFYAKT